MTKPKLTLLVVSQDKKLFEGEVDSVSAPTTTGVITILPNHIPLLSLLQTGELVFRSDKTEETLVISKGFIDLEPNNHVTVIVDTAVHARDISISKAEAAIEEAHKTMAQTTNQRELLLAEASLRQALWEIKVAQKTKKAKI